MNETLIAIASLCAVGLVSAVMLYFAAQKFKVVEDPRIDTVEAVLPKANCGGCGFPGCRNFAEACVKAEQLDTLFCPVGGNDGMIKVANVLGKTAVTQVPLVAVLRCNGSPQHRQRTNQYDGITNCQVAASLYGGTTDCQYGCLGHGDCVFSCKFDAMYMDEETQLPVIDDQKCTACGACVKACPNKIIELRKRHKKAMKIYVSCVNCDKGGIAKKACSVACTGCTLCVKECAYNAITINNNLAFIDSQKCTLCRKCVVVCPTNAIHEINFPPRKEKLVEMLAEAK